MTEERTKNIVTSSEAVTIIPSRASSARRRSGVSAKNAGRITARLTFLYEDPLSAGIRETISNAMDATTLVPAARRRPVEITTPTFTHPFVTVTDHGIGMDEAIIDTFVEYGESTKEEDIEQTGSYGLGGKSILAYVPQLRVVTVRDGVERIFTMEIKPEGTYNEILSTRPTGASNGTSVSFRVESSDFSRAESIVNSYVKNSDFAPISVNGVLASGNPDRVYLGDITIHEQTGATGRVFASRDLLRSMLTDSSLGAHSIGYVLSGWTYGSDSPRLFVELKPGIVEFDSSRDSITQTPRSSELYSLVRRQTLVDHDFIRRAVLTMAAKLSPEELFAAARILRVQTSANPDNPSEPRAVMHFSTGVYGDKIVIPLDEIKAQDGTPLSALTPRVKNETVVYSASVEAENLLTLTLPDRDRLGGARLSRIVAKEDPINRLVEDVASAMIPGNDYLRTSLSLTFATDAAYGVDEVYLAVPFAPGDDVRNDLRKLFRLRGYITAAFPGVTRIVLLQSATLGKDDLAAIEALPAQFRRFTMPSFAEVFSKLTAARKAEQATVASLKPAPKLDTLTLQGYDLSEGSADIFYAPKGLRSDYRDVVAAQLSPADDILVVLGDGYIGNIVRGAENAGKNLAGKRLYSVKSLPQGFAQAIPKGVRVWFSPTAKARSKRVQELKEGNAFSASLAKREMEEFSDVQLHYALIYSGRRLKHTPDNFRLIASQIRGDFAGEPLGELFVKLADAMDYTPAISSSVSLVAVAAQVRYGEEYCNFVKRLMGLSWSGRTDGTTFETNFGRDTLFSQYALQDTPVVRMGIRQIPGLLKTLKA